MKITSQCGCLSVEVEYSGVGAAPMGMTPKTYLDNVYKSTQARKTFNKHEQECSLALAMERLYRVA